MTAQLPLPMNLPPSGDNLEAPKGPNVVSAEEIVEEALFAKLKGMMHDGLVRSMAHELAVHVVACLDEVLLIAPDLVEQEHGETCSCQDCIDYWK